MIFLFFTSSLGPLEPELGPFKDWQEIGDIWEISLKVASAPESWCPGCTASPWGRFPKYQMSPNFMLQQCVITWYSQNWCKKNNGNCLLLYTHILPGTVFCHVVIWDPMHWETSQYKLWHIMDTTLVIVAGLSSASPSFSRRVVSSLLLRFDWHHLPTDCPAGNIGRWIQTIFIKSNNPLLKTQTGQKEQKLRHWFLVTSAIAK